VSYGVGLWRCLSRRLPHREGAHLVVAQQTGPGTGPENREPPRPRLPLRRPGILIRPGVPDRDSRGPGGPRAKRVERAGRTGVPPRLVTVRGLASLRSTIAQHPARATIAPRSPRRPARPEPSSPPPV